MHVTFRAHLSQLVGSYKLYHFFSRCINYEFLSISEMKTTVRFLFIHGLSVEAIACAALGRNCWELGPWWYGFSWYWRLREKQVKMMQLNAVRLVAVARWQISDFRNRWFGSEVQVHGTRWESHSLEADWGGCWKRPGDEMKGVPKTVTRSCGTCPFSGLSGVWIIDPLVWSTLNLVAWNTCRHSNLIKLVDGKSPGVSQPGICNRKRS